MSANPLLEPGEIEEPHIPEEPVEEAPPEVPAAAEAPPEEKPAEPPADDAETKYNNLRAALREERAEKAQIAAEMGALRERISQLDQIKAELDQFRQSKAVEQQQSEFDSDPAGYLKNQVEQLSKRQQELLEQSTRQNEQEVQQQRLFSAIQSQASKYRNENPDYDNAFAFMHQRRMAEYEVIGVPVEQREALFTQESVQFAAQVMQAGRNPAEAVYDLARVSGYTPAQAAKAAGVTEGQTKAQAEKTIERLEAGQKASATLSGSGRSGESVLKSIESMSDAEFDKYWNEQVVPSRS